jgi:hypothetical protein
VADDGDVANLPGLGGWHLARVLLGVASAAIVSPPKQQPGC